MSGAPVGPFLPPGPWRVAKGYVGRRRAAGWVVRVLAGLVAAAFGWFLVGEVSALRRDVALYADPATAVAPAEFRGEERSYLGALATYRGTVTFTTPDGVDRQEKVDFATLLTIDMRTPLSVRYRPDAPGNCVTNWAAEHVVGRWAMMGVFAGIGLGLLPWALWYLAKATLRRARVGAALALEGHEVVARLVKVTDVKQYGRVINRVYAAELPVGGRCVRVLGEFPPKQAPCFVGAEHLLLAASTHAPGEAIVLRSDLWPLVLEEAERDAALARIAAAGG